ncbi:hypothetical protein [Amphibacillus cookii]|uniref:hypothetical protein n=1 Tax=Amphibacillus cookii TaxID=767787 RepID=UPI00195E4674|nr:hypothetical protein [Amphibacillus cookii]MBM7540962.1 hypothetical protein [Amphibacillus cookii]
MKKLLRSIMIAIVLIISIKALLSDASSLVFAERFDEIRRPFIPGREQNIF